MNPAVRVLSFVLIAIGAVLSFGVYRAFPAGVPKTVTFVFLPLLHLGTGAGLFFGKPTARPAAFFLALFYVFLGVLVWNQAVSVIDFIPVVPLAEFVPIQILKLDPSFLKGLCFFAFPAAAVLILSLKSAAFGFEPNLQGRFSWSAPVPVLIAGAFVFSYSLLARSETALFLSAKTGDLFGYSLNPFAAKAVNYAEFCLPFIIAFAFLTGEKWAWLLGLLYGVYYWLSFMTGGFRLEDLRDFKFLFFGTGWMFTMLTLEFSWKFFWKQEAWADERAAGKRNRFFSILFLVLSGTTLTSAALFLFPGLRAIQLPRPAQMLKSKAPIPREKIPAPSPASPRFRLEGTSVDSQGSYALINGELVKAGAILKGFRVDAVERNSVLLSKEGKKYRLTQGGRLAEI